MKKIMVAFAVFLVLPSVSSAAALTPQQSSSLIAVVQSSPSIPASAFVSLITAFSNITVNQATSLITVVQSAPGVPATAFVDLLTSFTVDTPATQSTNIVPNTTPASVVTPPVVSTSAQTSTSGSVVSITPLTSGGNVDPQNGLTMWKASILVSGKAVSVKELKLKQIGSINQSDLTNFRFSIDDIAYGSAVASLDADGYVTFGGNARLELGNHNLKLLGDVIAGNGKTLSFQLQRSSDIKVIDTTSNQSVIPSQFQAVSGGTFNINTGRLVVTKSSDSPTGTVVAGASGVVLARYKLEAYSEEIRLGLPSTSFTTNDSHIGSLRNVALYANGITFPASSGLRINPGSSIILEVRGDVYDNDGTNDISSNDTIQISLLPGLSVTGMNSLVISDSLTEKLPGNTLTVVDTTPRTTFSFNGNEGANNTYSTRIGDTVRLGWSTQYSYGGECTASGDWSGKKIEGNSEDLTFIQAGTFNYILTCVNGLNGERGTSTAIISAN